MKKLSYAVLLVLLITVGCKKVVKQTTPTKPAPAKATLLLPANNQPCLTGSNLTATQSTVTFTWQTTANTDHYELHYKNLLTGVTNMVTIATTSKDVVLPLNTPFSWFVVSTSTGTTATGTSDTWKFYNAGPGATNFAPYPADLLSPALSSTISAATGKTTLQWSGSDADNNIVSYDVYFGTTKVVPLLKSQVTGTSIDVSIAAGNTYYWKIVTTDSQGFTSDSGVFSFLAN